MRALTELMARWVDEALRLRNRYAMETAALICEAHARELEAAVREVSAELLTVAEAATESGYSEQHIRALVAAGEIPNAGRKGRPRVRRGDLPHRKAGRHAPTQAGNARSAMPRKRRRRSGFDARRIVENR